MYIGDLHIHSRYSRATSKEGDPEHLELWARKKGIDLLGTGDFTHPAWRAELAEKLEPAEDGFYVLKKEYRLEDGETPPDRRPRFVVTGEISSIYKKQGRVRKVHSLLILPSLTGGENLSRRLELIGNLHSDGRPILGLDCRDLLEILLETCPKGIYVPAHIWTPHFSLFGAFSGFDRIEDCFEDLTPEIHALETGLSSDPPMNWRVSALDAFHLISNSDAHSPAKLGREANLFSIELCYQGLFQAIQQGEGLAGTLEFFPEEGKYHLDGHRKCGICLEPGEAERLGNVCPACGKKLTVGVLHRVEELADRKDSIRPENARPFESLVPLPEVLAASTGLSVAGKKIQALYGQLLARLGSEFFILRQAPEEDIRRIAGPRVAEGIRRLRRGEVKRTPGFDGAYGKIQLFTEEEASELEGQLSLFTQAEWRQWDAEAGRRTQAPAVRTAAERAKAASAKAEIQGETPSGQADLERIPSEPGYLAELNLEQREAVCARERAVAVIAGPGTGKTKTLIARLRYLLEVRGVDPEQITAVTFTRQAAAEMRNRLEQLPGGKEWSRRLWMGTFHALCSRLLSEAGHPVSLADMGLQRELAEQTRKVFGLNVSGDAFLREVSRWKNQGAEEVPPEAISFYQNLLSEAGVQDYDDLLLAGQTLASNHFRFILVDEFQDINPVQYQLVQNWNRRGEELFVIGDPDQSIYGFRGSDAHCFARLSTDFPGLRQITLLQNYRSTPEILSSALSLISHNPGTPRFLEAFRQGGRPIRLAQAPGEKAEAIFIAKEINRLVGGIDMLGTQEEDNRKGREIRGFGEVAVLYRTHRQARALEDCLRQEGIPYLVAGREDFLTEPEVRGALCFFRYLLHPEDTGARQLAQRLLWPGEGQEAGAWLEVLAQHYQKRITRNKPEKLLEEWQNEVKVENPEAFRRLADMSVLHPTMEDFLETLTFGEEGDVRRSGSRRFSADAVTLMTFHGSKGLEFPVVFLCGARKGLTPLELEAEAADIEEERRLFFVAMTRARDELILTCSGPESSFLGELDTRSLVRENVGREPEREEIRQLSLFDFL